MKHKKIFVTATNTEVGKTFTTVKLIELFNKKGIKTLGCKPIETGVSEENISITDTYKIYNANKANYKEIPLERLNTYSFKLPAAPFVAKEGQIEITKLQDSIALLEQECDLLIIEGAGGLKVPILKEFFMLDLAKLLDCYVVLVCDAKLGCINSTLLSLETINNYKLPHTWFVNTRSEGEAFAKTSEPFFREYFDDFLKIEDDFTPLFERLLSSVQS